MITYFRLFVAAWLLLLAETVVVPECLDERIAPVAVWLLLPWLAVWIQGPAGIAAGAVYGLLIDCLSTGPVGPGVVLCSVTVAVLQRTLTDQSLESFVRRTGICVTTSLLLSGFVALVTLTLNQNSAMSSIVHHVTAVSIAAFVVAVSVSIVRRIPFLSPEERPELV